MVQRANGPKENKGTGAKASTKTGNIAKENIYEERKRRIANNKVAFKDESAYLTDPENGNIIKVENIKPVKAVKHNADNSTSVIYIAKHKTNTRNGDIEQLDSERKIAFEISQEDMEALKYNQDPELTKQFRRMMSSANVSRFVSEPNSSAKRIHLGYIRKGRENYEILLPSEVSKRFLEDLERQENFATISTSDKSRMENENIEGPSTDDNDEGNR